MSEYEFNAFRAVDRPLDDKQFKFAERQSSHADVTRWAMTVDYHHSSFRGNINALLRGGYDVFLQYTNYGCREIRLRIPRGLSFGKRVIHRFIDDERLIWENDKKGKGGILKLSSFQEEGFDPVWDFDAVINASVNLRRQLIEGDARVLYVFWVCTSLGDNWNPEDIASPPVPGGLSQCGGDCEFLLDYFEIDPLILKAAGEDASSDPPQIDQQQRVRDWIESTSPERLRELMLQIANGDAASVKAEWMTEIRDAQSNPDWPLAKSKRTLADLLNRTEELRGIENVQLKKNAAQKAKRDAAKVERARQKRMKIMAQDPQHWMTHAEELVEARGTKNYIDAAKILSELKAAVGGKEGESVARKHAAHLVRKHPTLTMLKSSLRKQGLID